MTSNHRLSSLLAGLAVASTLAGCAQSPPAVEPGSLKPRAAVVEEQPVPQYTLTNRSPESERAAVRTMELAPTPNFVPPQVGTGDADFYYNGPAVHASVRLSVRNNQLWARVYMHAKETGGDRTEVEGSADYVVYTGPEKIIAIAPDCDTYTSKEYTDTNKKDDVFEMPEGEPVRSFRFVGDTGGKEAGTRTGVSVTFNPIRVIVEK